MKKSISILFLFLIITSNLFSQVTEEWVARYNGSSNYGESAYAIAIDRDGNAYVTGYSYNNSQRFDVVTIKYNSAGVQQWVAIYNSPIDSSDFGWSIAVDDSANVYVAAESYGVGSDRDYTTIKYNSLGVEQWVVRYNGTGNSIDVPAKLVLDNMSNVYVVGYSFGLISEITSVKYNSAGTLQWAARFSDTNNYYEYGRSICVDNQFNVYVTGDATTNILYTDYVTIKYNSNGIQQWVAFYNGTADKTDQPFSVNTDNQDNVYVTGRSEGIGSSFDIVTVKYNSVGVQQWVERYDGSNHGFDEAYNLDFDSWGNFYIGGRENIYSSLKKIVTIKYDSHGVQQWVSKYDASNMNVATCMKVDTIGNVYVAGSVTGANAESDYVTLRYNSIGVLLWAITYNGPANSYDYIRSIDINKTGNIWVTGVSVSNHGQGGDYCTIKYSQPIGIQPISSEVPKQFYLYQNYPNPFNPTTKIKFSISTPLNPPEGGTRDEGAISPLSARGGFGEGQEVRLIIYDILGREITILVNQRLTPGTYEVEWDATGGASNYSSGVYFYRLYVIDASSPQANPLSIIFSETRKMVLLK